MATKNNTTLVLGEGCISCAHNKDINLYKDMYRMSTEKNETHAQEGRSFLNALKDNPPKRTECRFYNSDDGLLCEYFVERDYCKDSSSCPDYLEMKFEKAPTTRVKTVEAESEENSGEVREIREVIDEENPDFEELD